ncbi:hypothetical protein Goshw_007196 [Gossypium schwendimanii]|uniref:Uncharacterized protein n=1 Tax=Gossypium schwendimanii TaxID=34291 RepID=A0A7J9M1Q4_GOSSC|nr:hypothetical protein [Gossypium schwendimanii]
METRGRSRENSRSRDMLLALKGKVTNLEESMSSVKETLKELEGELALYRAAVGKGKLTLAPKQHKMDIRKSKEFNGTRFARDVENFLWRWKKSFIELDPRKDKFESSKPKETCNGGRDHEEDRNGNGGNGKNSGNGKSHNGKWKSNNKPKGLVKCFICDGSHMRVRENENKPMKCFLCCGSHRMRDYLERSKMSGMSKENEAEPVEFETLKLGLVILNFAKLAKDVPCDGDIDLVYDSATKTPLEML